MGSDQTLLPDVRAVAAGDRQAWARLIQALAQRMHAAAYRILGDAQAAEDATQDACIALGRAAAACSAADDAAVVRWSVAIACRCALHHRRSHSRRERLVRTGLPAESERMANDQGSVGPDPQVAEAALRAFHRLPDRHRLPIALHVFGGVDGVELARELGVSVNAARVRLHRASRKLKAMLVAEGVTASLATVCADLGQLQTPPPSTALLARCQGAEWSTSTSSAHPYRRIIMAASMASSIALLACLGISHLLIASDQPVTPPPQVADTPAPPRVAAEPTTPALTLLWEATGPQNNFVGVAPVLAGDELLLLCGMEELACVDRHNAKARWRVRGSFNHSSPAVVDDVVVALTDTGVAAYALADGAIRWSTALDGNENDASIIVHGRRALVATRAGTLYSLDLDHQGHVAWRCANPAATASAPGVAGDGRLLLPLWREQLVCLDEASGTVRWRAQLPGLGATPPVCSGGVVYTLTEDPKVAGCVVALDEASGLVRWRQTVPQDHSDGAALTSLMSSPDHIAGAVTFAVQTVGAAAGPALADCVVVVGSRNDLLGYAPDGRLLWRVPFHSFGYRGFSVDGQGRIRAGGDHGELLAVSARGRVLLRTNLNQDPAILGRPVLEAEGDSAQSPSVGSLSNPCFDGDRVYLLTSGGVALSWKLSSRF